MSKSLINKLKIPKDVAPWALHYVKWHKENISEIISAEQTLVHPSGYGGTTDLYCRLKDGSRALVDYKTQNVKEKGPKFYDSWIYQLVAYRACFPEPEDIKCVSVILNSNKAEPLVHKIWSDKEIEGAQGMFNSALQIWQIQNKYKPRN